MQKQEGLPPEKNHEEELDWRIRSVIPLAMAIRIVLSNNPREVLQTRNDGIWLAPSIFVAVTLTVIAFLGQMGTPWNHPFYSFYGYLLPFIETEYDFPVLFVIAAIPVFLSVYAYLICSWTGSAAVRIFKNKNIKKVKNERKVAVYIAFACIISCTFVSIVAAVLVMLVAWLMQKYFGFYIHVKKFNAISMALLAAVMIWYIPKIFRRAEINFEDKATSYLYSFLLAVIVTFPSITGSFIISDYLESTLMARGAEKNLAYNRPISSSVFSCERVSSNLSCVIALYPQKWQNFELIGKWDFGRMKPDGSHIVNSQWQPRILDGKSFPTVFLEQKKYITIELLASEKKICRTKKIPIEDDDSLFFAMGRVTDEHRFSARNLRIHVENGEQSFAKIVAAACVA